MPQTTHAHAAAPAVTLRDDHLALTWADGTRNRFHYVWLRDNCRHPDRWNAETGERQALSETIPAHLTAIKATVDDAGGIHLEWSDGAAPSRFDLDWLWDNRYDPPRPYSSAARLAPWGADDGAAIPSFAHDRLFAAPGELERLIAAYRRRGLVRVTGVPRRSGEVERFAERLAYVREIAFDRVADIKVTPGAYTLGFTAAPLPLHTDCSGYAWPPNVMLFHCLRNDAVGGESLYADGARAVEELRRRDPAALEALCRIPVQHCLYSQAADTRHIAPRIQLDEAGQLAILRYANWTPLPQRPHAFEDVPAFYRAQRRLAEILNAPDSTIEVRPAPGDLLMINNQRVLHGRRGFEPNSGARHFQQVYMELDDLVSLQRVIARRAAEAASASPLAATAD